MRTLEVTAMIATIGKEDEILLLTQEDPVYFYARSPRDRKSVFFGETNGLDEKRVELRKYKGPLAELKGKKWESYQEALSKVIDYRKRMKEITKKRR